MIIPQSAIDEILSNEPGTEGITDVATVGLNTAKKVVDTTATVTKAIVSVKGTIGKNSITRMGKDSIMEFPTVMSNGIDIDEQIPIAKQLEFNYATLLVSIFSLRPSVSLNEYDNIAEYIKSIHSNTALPTNLKKAQHFAKESLEGLHPEDDDFYCLVDGEDPSGFCVDGSITHINAQLEKDLALECWGVQGDMLDTENLNEISMPYKRSQSLLNARLDIARKEREKKAAAIEAPVNPTDTTTVDENVLDSVRGGAMRVVNTGRNTTNMLNGRTANTKLRVGDKANSINVLSHQHISLEPTLINVSFYLHGSKSGNGGNANFTQTVTLGVKSMIRNVSSEYMIAQLVEGSKSSNPIFKIISWTRGEYKFIKDLLFNISEIKKKYKNKKDRKSVV